MGGMGELGTLSFRIEFEYLTKLARQGWAEGRYQWAMDLLRDSGAPKESWADVIRGYQKMITNEDGSGLLAEDSWSPNLSMCNHGEYPDPDRLFELAERATHWKQELWNRLRIEYDELWRQRERYYGNGRELEFVARQVREFPEEFIESLPLERQDLWKWAHLTDGRSVRDYPGTATIAITLASMGTGLPSYETDLDDYMRHEQELSERPTPSAQAPGEVETGWILPDGRAYACGWNEHDWLAYRLGGGSTKDAEKLGWVLLGRSPVAQKLIPSHLEDTPLTQRQLDALWDWCQMNEVAMPDWIADE